jgi:hypothetical protein
VSTPLPEGQQGAKAEALTDKIQAAINQTAWDSTAAVSFSFRGNHHYLWDKKRNLVQVEWDDKKVLYNTQTMKVSLMKMIKNLPTLKKRCYKKGMTTSIMIHSGLSRLSNYETLVLPEYRDAG